jgi:hypothetical protein
VAVNFVETQQQKGGHEMKIFTSKSKKLAYRPGFLVFPVRRDDPQEFNRVVKGVFLIFVLVAAFLVASGLHRHFIGG